MAKIEWKGGECPVSGDTKVKIYLRNTETQVMDAKYFYWSNNNRPTDIIAYEVIEEEPKQITEKTLRDEFAIAWIKGGHQPSYDAYIFADSMMKSRMK